MDITGNKPIFISFQSLIGPQTANVLMGALGEKTNQDFDEIHLLLSSPGGQVREGIAVYNFIQALPIPVVTYNIGSIDSIANVVYQAGKRRISSRTSSFMFHGVGFDIQNTRMELKQLNEMTASLQNDQSLIADIMIRHTGMTRDEINGLFLAMEYMTAQKALDRGITDEVGDIHVPKGVPISQLIFQ